MSTPNPEQLVQIQFQPPRRGWMDPAVEFRKGTFCYSALARNLKYLDLPNPREWNPRAPSPHLAARIAKILQQEKHVRFPQLDAGRSRGL